MEGTECTHPWASVDQDGQPYCHACGIAWHLTEPSWAWPDFEEDYEDDTNYEDATIPDGWMADGSWKP